MVIPIADTSVKEINVSIFQNDKEILNKSFVSVENVGFGISDLDNAICLTNNPEAVKANLFLIDKFSTKLNDKIFQNQNRCRLMRELMNWLPAQAQFVF
ncbi:MAG: hypothetical protein HC831_22325 [Chloroflexia bacterium]|nr:hypothetical protein [Chloroflexia bacterium]